jgi:hypothetical protein
VPQTLQITGGSCDSACPQPLQYVVGILSPSLHDPDKS